MANTNFNQRGQIAETIVNNYGDALSAEPNGIARSVSKLKNSKEEIEIAIKDYIVYLVKTGKLTKDIIKVLSYGYASLELFTDDDNAELVNNLGRQMKTEKLPPELFNIYNDFVKNSSRSMKERVVEITEFIKEQVPGS